MNHPKYKKPATKFPAILHSFLNQGSLRLEYQVSLTIGGGGGGGRARVYFK